MRLLTFVVLGAWSACCSNPARVVSFDVQPRTACPGDRVVVSWDVVGKARLAVVEMDAPVQTEPDPDAILAKEQDVASYDSKVVHVAKPTWFAIRATEANQAKEHWIGKQPVDVPNQTSPRGGVAICTFPECTSKFTVHASPRSRVVEITHPTLREAGREHDAKICVTHASLSHACIDPGGTLAVSLPPDGEWQLETTLPADASRKPPAMSVDLHITCL